MIAKLLLLLVALVALKTLPFAFVRADELWYREREFTAHDFDTVLIGSSRTQFGIIPSYFDALNGNRTKTYNFGISAGLLPYSADWCEAVIRSSRSLRYVIVELTGSGGLFRQYNEPWVEFRSRDYLKAMATVSFRKASEYHDQLALDFLKPRFVAGEFFDYNTPREQPSKDRALPARTVSRNELAHAYRRNRTLAMGGSHSEGAPDEEVWRRLVRLMAHADSAGVRVYFFIPPRLETDSELESVSRLWTRLEARRKLPVNHFEDRLYTLESSYDEFHLSRTGATRFTENLAAVFTPQ